MQERNSISRQGEPDCPSPEKSSDRGPILSSRPVLDSSTGSFLFGGLVCLAFGIVDIVVLEIAHQSQWSNGATGFTFALFVIQTFVISSLVGRGVKACSEAGKKYHVIAWYFFFGWSLAFTNVFLIWVLINSSYLNGVKSSFVYAFFSAQIGLSVCWLVLGKLNWKKRVPIACAVAFLASYPLWAGVEDWSLLSYYLKRSWRFILFANLISIFVTCGILRFFRFGFDVNVSPTGGSSSAREIQRQFSIRHLFIWTTVVAVLFAVGRYVPWKLLWNQVLLNPDYQFFLLVSLLMTLLFALVLWGALGVIRPRWLKIPIVILFLAVIAAAAYWNDISYAAVRSSTLAGGWANTGATVAQRNMVLFSWVVWTVLNGLFLMSMLRVFQINGTVLARREKKTLIDPESDHF